MQVTRTSFFSGKVRTLDIDITKEQLYEIEYGNELIQNVVPHLSGDDREFLLTGITPEEWNELHDEDEEDIF